MRVLLDDRALIAFALGTGSGDTWNPASVRIFVASPFDLLSTVGTSTSDVPPPRSRKNAMAPASSSRMRPGAQSATA